MRNLGLFLDKKYKNIAIYLGGGKKLFVTCNREVKVFWHYV